MRIPPQLQQLHLGRYFARTVWWWAGIATALLLALLRPAGLQRLDLLAYDLLLPRMEPSAQAPVVIAIDDASLARLGQWPWPRSLHAQMVDALRQAGARSIGFAVLFAEPDPHQPAGDAALAAAAARHGHVVLATAPQPLPDGGIAALPLLPALAGGTAPPRQGHADVEIDIDGQARSLFLYAGAGRPELPALALAVQSSATDAPATIAPPDATPPAPGRWVRDKQVYLMGMSRPPQVLSFADALHSPALHDAVQGRSVFIGVTATGLGGQLVTPLAPAHTTLPAVLFHAHAYDAMQSGALVWPLPDWLPLVLALLALGVLALWPQGNARRAVPLRALLGALMLGLPLAASAALLQLGQWWLPPALCTLSLAVALAFRGTTRLREASRNLQRVHMHAQATLRALNDAVVTIDARRRRVRFANPAARRQAFPHQLEGQQLQRVYPLSPDSHARLQQAIDGCLRDGQNVYVHDLLELQPDDGAVRSLRTTVSPLRSPEDVLEGAVLVFTDVTRVVSAARELEYAATHDPLTGLPNRALLHQRLAQTLSRLQRKSGSAALLFIDLDRFKHVNDSLGHHTGDAVLKVLAGRLRALCRDTDTVARWGGDEFVLILEDVAGQEGATMAATKIVQALSQDIELGREFNHLRLPCAGSVGVVLLPRDGTQIEELLSKADMAMYRAKDQPKSGFHFWARELDAHMQDRLALEVDLRQAMHNGRLQLHYQPQFSLQDGRLVGMEALMRWQRTPTQMVPPGEFIPLAEDTGLIIDMGAWAFLQAARQVAQWLRAGLQPVPVAVNVSARQCQNRDLVQVVRMTLRETRIPPELLRVEITESTAMWDAEQVRGLLQDIRTLGVGLSLDDFGTGHSSLVNLKNFPLHELKIDRSFVRALPHNQEDAAIVHATIALAHGLGLKVVAEGVETEEQSRFLAASHCDTAQGFLYGRPVAAGEATRQLPPRERDTGTGGTGGIAESR